MNTEPLLKLLRKYKGDLLKASRLELITAFEKVNDDLEYLIDKAEQEYKKEQEQAGSQEPKTQT